MQPVDQKRRDRPPFPGAADINHGRLRACLHDRLRFKAGGLHQRLFQEHRLEGRGGETEIAPGMYPPKDAMKKLLLMFALLVLVAGTMVPAACGPEAAPVTPAAPSPPAPGTV